jgi:hypothetical protein
MGRFQVEPRHSGLTYRLKLPPGSQMYPVVYVAWLRPFYVSDGLASVPDCKEDSAYYTDFYEYPVP